MKPLDPDLLQAMEDFRARFAQLRAERRAMRKLDPTVDHAKRQASQRLVATIIADISTRAQRLGMKSGALIAILAAEADEMQRLRRRPSRQQLEKALVGNRRYHAEQLADARHNLERAQREFETAERLSDHAAAACLAYTGYAG